MNRRPPKRSWSSTIFPYLCKRSKDEGSVLFRKHTAGGAMKPARRCSMAALRPSRKSSNPLKPQSTDFASTGSTAPKKALCIPSHGIQLPILLQITSWWSCQLDPIAIRQRGHFRQPDLRAAAKPGARPYFSAQSRAQIPDAPNDTDSREDPPVASGLEGTALMKTVVKALQPLVALIAFFCHPVAAFAQAVPDGPAIDAKVGRIMARTHANGMAVAVIDHGKVGYVHAYGIRNAKGDPLTTDTVMYGASLTNAVFAYTVMQLVDQGRIKLDTPLKDDLDTPLPSYGPDAAFPDKYGPYKDLADDPRWEKITPRMCLTHSTGFSNFWFIEPDQKLHIHFEPGTHFSYSGEGFILLQFVVEHGRAAQGLGLDVDDLTKADFKKLGMTRTSLVFVNGTDDNLADGWNDQGQAQEHDKRKKVRVAGSMDTTISDF